MTRTPDHAELLRFLCHVRFPADKSEILRQCGDLGAPKEYLHRLGSLPEGTFIEADTVLQALPHPET